jgi:hypothetical protein
MVSTDLLLHPTLLPLSLNCLSSQLLVNLVSFSHSSASQPNPCGEAWVGGGAPFAYLNQNLLYTCPTVSTNLLLYFTLLPPWFECLLLLLSVDLVSCWYSSVFQPQLCGDNAFSHTNQPLDLLYNSFN